MILLTAFPEGRVDALLLTAYDENNNPHHIAFDSGFYSDGVDMVKRIKGMGISKIDIFVATHAHKNHIGGAGHVIHNLNPNAIYVSHKKVWPTIVSYSAKGSERKHVETFASKVKILAPGDSFLLGLSKILCCGPLKIQNVSVGALSENYNSLVLKAVDPSGKYMLLTGDTSAAVLQSIQKKYAGTEFAINDCEVLKNPHHNGALPSAMLKNVIRPKVVIVCNSSLPSSAYRKILKSIGAAMLVTCSTKRGGVWLARTKIQ